MLKNLKLNIYNLLPNLFFLFFTAQVLSPKIYGKSYYLEVFFALLDPKFRVWIFSKFKSNSAVYLVFVLSPILLFKIALTFKIIFTIITIAYLFYAWENNKFYLERFFVLSVIVAIFQFIFSYVNKPIAIMLGPHNISRTLWGNYSMGNTNFYAAVTDFVRVSGLSREAGFFASLVVVVMFLTYIRYCSGEKQKMSWLIILMIAFFISFSKMSYVIFLVILIERRKKIINRLNTLFVTLMFVLFMILIWYHNSYLLRSDTFLHRFGAYSMFVDVDNFSMLLWGKDEISSDDFVKNFYTSKFWYVSQYNFFAGIMGAVYQYGFIMISIIILFLNKMKVSATGMILLFLFTINVDIVTNQNFVSLAYFIVFKFYRKGIDFNYKLRLNVSRQFTLLNPKHHGCTAFRS